MPAVSTLSTLIVCPVCRRDLAPSGAGLRCAGCGRRYDLRAGVPDLTPVPPPHEAVAERWPLWEELQRNGEQAYRADPPTSLSVGEREEPARFGTFCRLDGRVLDVGCGPQALPSYALGFEGELVGIDPLRGEEQRRFHFVRGIAEYLPFPDASFDRVLFATSLDHVLSPELAVAEAARVVKPDGAVLVWLGEVYVPPSPGDKLRQAIRLLRAGDLRGIGTRLKALPRTERCEPQEPPPAQPDLPVPEGAIDPFHFAHPEETTVRSWLSGAGLHLTDTERPLPGSCFIRATHRGRS
jgi:SAM-dependent methyltransferase